MVYNWEGKESECYRLYVEEKKSLDEVMEVFRAEGFNPRYVDLSYLALQNRSRAVTIYGRLDGQMGQRITLRHLPLLALTVLLDEWVG